MSVRGSYLCLDFQLNRIAAIEVENDRVGRWLVEPIPPGTLRGGEPVDPEELGARLGEALRRDSIRATRTRVALADEAFVTRVLELPPMRKSEMAGAVRYLAEKELPIPLDRAAWAWDVVEISPTRVTVMLIAAWADLLGRVGEVARSAGLRLEVVEPRALTVARALQVDSAMVLEASEAAALMTVLSPGGAPFTATSDRSDDEALAGLIARGQRHLAGARRPSTPARAEIVVAGDLAGPALGKGYAVLATDLLNGRAPFRPDEMPSAHLLAPIGLAMREGRTKGRSDVTFPAVNLAIPAGKRSARPLTVSSRVRTALLIGVALLAWSMTGAALATLLGWHPPLPAGS